MQKAASHLLTRTIYEMKLEYISTVALLTLCAISGAVSQLNLSPVYGSIPSSAYHRQGLIYTAILAFLASVLLRDIPRRTLMTCISLHACMVANLQHLLSQFSSELGATRGPFMVECVTTYPLIFMSLCVASSQLRPAGLKGMRLHVTRLLASVAWSVYIWSSENAILQLLHRTMGTNILFTRAGLQHTLAICYSCLVPSKVVFGGLALFTSMATYDVHLPIAAHTNRLNLTLHDQGWSLLERHESLTGYLSVLENTVDNYRILRCDHSLLGGEWLVTPARARDGMTFPEPIFTVFTTLEAVILMEKDALKQAPKPSGRGGEKSVAVVGLGIGTTPKAFIARGAHTTVIEIDPYVHYFASKYFDLSPNHTAFIDDAVTVVGNALLNGTKYDYIIHDVFTGGAEPIELFTVEFLSSLHGILRPGGAIAINFAGDLQQPSTKLVVNTIKSVFRRCRLFRDSPKVNGTDVDFINLIAFCTKEDEPWSFRQPEEADFLQSQTRREHLLPRLEVPWGEDMQSAEVLSSATSHVLKQHQRASAINHWKIMRTVLPDVVWELW